MLPTWLATVFSEMNSRTPICLLVRPSATSRATSASRFPSTPPATPCAWEATSRPDSPSGQAIKIGLAAMNLHGGQGYMSQHPWERYMRDALGLIGGQGAQELLLIQLGQHATFEIKGRHRTPP